MRMFRTEFPIEWGDCDEAGVVFYPNYFYWLDCTFQRLIRARGLSLRELRRRFSVVTPIIDAGAKFRAPARYDDTLIVEAFVDTWETKRFRVVYKLSIGERAVAEGFEVRAWAQIDKDGVLSGHPIDTTFKDLMK